MFCAEEEEREKDLGNPVKHFPIKTKNSLKVHYIHVVPTKKDFLPFKRRVNLFLYEEVEYSASFPYLFHQIGLRVAQLLALHVTGWFIKTWIQSMLDPLLRHYKRSINEIYIPSKN